MSKICDVSNKLKELETSIYQISSEFAYVLRMQRRHLEPSFSGMAGMGGMPNMGGGRSGGSAGGAGPTIEEVD